MTGKWADLLSGILGAITGQYRRDRAAAAAEVLRAAAKSRQLMDRRPPDLDPLRAQVAGAPSDLRAHLRLGWGLFGAAKYEEALEVFDRGRRDFPDDADLLYGLALTAKKLGKTDQADEAFLKAAASAERMSDPGRSEILHRLAMGHHNHLRSGRWGLKREVWGAD